jgi:hypothetical protein
VASWVRQEIEGRCSLKWCADKVGAVGGEGDLSHSIMRSPIVGSRTSTWCRAQRGRRELLNLVAACSRCNSHRGSAPRWPHPSMALTEQYRVMQLAALYSRSEDDAIHR